MHRINQNGRVIGIPLGMVLISLMAWSAGDVHGQETPSAKDELTPAVQITMKRDRFTVKARDATLEEILVQLDELAKVDLRVAPALLDKRFTIDLKNATYEQVMKALAASHALIYERDAEGNARIVGAQLTTQEAPGEEEVGLQQRRERRRQHGEIRQALKDLSELYGYAGVLDYDAAKALVQDRNQKFDELVARLAALGPGGAQAIQELYGEAGSTRAQLLMVKALGLIQDPEASQTLATLYGQNASVSMQREMISSLSKRSDPETQKALEGILENEQNTLLKAASVMALSTQPGAVKALIDVVGSDEQKQDVRQEAIRSLGQIGGDEARQALEQVATKPGDTAVRRSAIQELGRTYGDSALSAFEALMADPDEAIRFNTVKALARVKAPGCQGLLAKAAASDASEAVRKTAEYALAQSGEPAEGVSPAPSVE